MPYLACVYEDILILQEYTNNLVRCSALQCVAVRCIVLQCVAVCCSVLQCVAVCCSVVQWWLMCRHIHYRISPVSSKTFRMLGADTYTRTSCRNTRTMQYVAVCCSVLQCVAVCCSVLQCVAVMPYVQTHTLAHLVETHARYSMLQCVAACCDVLRCVAMCCSVLQCVAVCCSES